MFFKFLLKNKIELENGSLRFGRNDKVGAWFRLVGMPVRIGTEGRPANIYNWVIAFRGGAWYNRFQQNGAAAPGKDPPMASFTRKAIKETFITLLDERPLSSITVKDIVETCGINRNSFYYHFSDLPDLIEEIIEEEAERIIAENGAIHSITECFDAVISFASHRRRAIMHIYRSVSRDVFERHLTNVSEYFVRQYLGSSFSDSGLSPELRDALVNYYACLCFGLILNWLANGMPEEQVRSIRQIFTLQEQHAPELEQLLRSASPAP